MRKATCGGGSADVLRHFLRDDLMRPLNGACVWYAYGLKDSRGVHVTAVCRPVYLDHSHPLGRALLAARALPALEERIRRVDYTQRVPWVAVPVWVRDVDPFHVSGTIPCVCHWAP
eukprot:CAMPEP_0185776304 /NCGR_PEP_ID=MMETSP1174-20130828/85166_1 /TAXON_ID=35687 /ORGANISM="Dictyocha speculum, Strain CCMP1381" /LENGTH=115 /DNA_ID=CAMNT_0028464197 /DNA_START=132 /DNA_END=479 /DNA_ORIENTATION=+